MLYVHPDYWKSNGFSSLPHMVNSFRVIADFVEGVAGPSPHVLDTYCRNGALLRVISFQVEGMTPWGICDHPNYVHDASVLWPRYSANFAIADISSTPWPVPSVDVALIMPGRLVGLPEQLLLDVLNELNQKAGKIVAYAHLDWINRFGSLEALCEEVRLKVVSISDDKPTHVAEVVTL